MALMGAMLTIGKQVMSGLPNISPVALLIILFTLELPHQTFGAITVFLVLQGVLYGFGPWWAMYLYVWYVLMGITWLLRRMDNTFGWAVVAGLFGLSFGGLCALTYIPTFGVSYAIAWWINGLSYDAIHGAGNFVMLLLLYRPLRRGLQLAKKQINL